MLLPDIFLSHSFEVHINAWIKIYIYTYNAAQVQSFETLIWVIFKDYAVIFSFTKGERLQMQLSKVRNEIEVYILAWL